jgi:hypothetical protein
MLPCGRTEGLDEVLLGISSAPPSTITMASLLAATTSSRSLLAISERGVRDELAVDAATRTPAMGPAHGMSRCGSAADAPRRASMSGVLLVARARSR